MGALIKILVICLLVYWSVRFILNLALPLYTAIKKIQKQQNSHNTAGFTNGNAAAHSPSQFSYKGGEYIDYEEVESRRS